MSLVMRRPYAGGRPASWTNLTFRRASPARRAAGWPQTLPGRPGEAAKLAVEVGLVVVAAVGRDLGEAAAVVVAEAVHRSSEADQRGQRLGRRPNLLAKPGHQVAVTTPKLGGERADLQAPAGLVQAPAGPSDLRRGEPRSLDPAGDIGVEQLEPGVPLRGVHQPRHQLVGRAAQHRVERHHEVGRELVHSEPEQHVRAERGQVDLNAAQAPVLGRDRVRRVQACDERMLDRLGMAGSGHSQRRPEAQDDRHLVLGDLAPARVPGPLVRVAAVTVDDARKRGVRGALDALVAPQVRRLVADDDRPHESLLSAGTGPATPPDHLIHRLARSAEVGGRLVGIADRDCADRP